VSLKMAGDVYAGVVQECGCEIHVEDHVVANTSRFDFFGVPNEEWHAEGFFVHKAFVVPAVVAEVKALVRCIDDDGVVGEVFFVQVVQYAASLSSTDSKQRR